MNYLTKMIITKGTILLYGGEVCFMYGQKSKSVCDVMLSQRLQFRSIKIIHVR